MAVTALVGALSIRPILNMISPGQMMNSSFEPLHLVNTYGAFGSVTRDRHEIVIEGTDDEQITAHTVWREYEFKGKPGDVSRRAPQIAPYHLRLDWLMWFAAMSDPSQHRWFSALLDETARGRRPNVESPPHEPVPGSPPAPHPGGLLRVSIHHPGRTEADGALVESRPPWRIRRA